MTTIDKKYDFLTASLASTTMYYALPVTGVNPIVLNGIVGTSGFLPSVFYSAQSEQLGATAVIPAIAFLVTTSFLADANTSTSKILLGTLGVSIFNLIFQYTLSII